MPWRSFLSSTPRAGRTLPEAARHPAVVCSLWGNVSVRGLNRRRSQSARTAYRTGAAAARILPSSLSQSHQTGFLKIKEKSRKVRSSLPIIPPIGRFAPSCLTNWEFSHKNIQPDKKALLLHPFFDFYILLSSAISICVKLLAAFSLPREPHEAVSGQTTTE